MESDAKYTVVGVVVTAIAVMVVVAILWLSDSGAGKRADYYSVYFGRFSLAGLQIDSDVTMRGIKVGSVASISISREDITKVSVSLKLDQGTPIKTDSKAVIRRNLLTGLAWIDVIGSSQEAPFLTTVASGETYPVIPEGKTELQEVTDSIPDVVEKIGTFLSRIEGLLSDENLKLVNSTLANVESFSSLLAKKETKLTQLIDDISQGAADFRVLSASWKDSSGDVEQIVEEMQSKILAIAEKLTTLSASLEEELPKAVSEVRAAMQIISVEAMNASHSLRQGVDAFSRAAEGFEEPKSIIFGPSKSQLGPGEGSLLGGSQ